MTPDSGNAHQGKAKHKVGFGLVFLIVLVLATLTFIPLLDSNRWWVRLLDFPRLQGGIALLILAVPVAFYVRYFRKMAGLGMILIVSALSYHGLVLFPYFQSGQDFPEAECRPGSAMSVMIANVKMRNDPDGRLLELVREMQPDLFLAMETNEKWNEALAPLDETMPHTVSHISDSTFGIHLFSRLALESPEIRFLAGQGTPQVVTGVTLASGETVDFLGVHPRPPVPSQSNTTLGRDAVLYKAALLLRESERTGIVAGDFNATPWENAVKRMRQIGNLQEPRRGYGYLPTFNATSWWMSWPLDHIFHEPGFATLSLERLGSFGSDHYPFVGRFCRISEHEALAPPQTDRELINEAERAIEAAKDSG
ncbi:endonuclease/exonuclease/phosphatase family protein [Marinobacter orientalis]|uniref:Endonuclease/exonuclease/phosphatase family protein n=1 Tax=Marinobacter orientalis TaxID=1928859 RepID=A0A7Y0WRR0_9GAMM|nr:endonuclease/exonuclease/phosphatase family protein [Marinobacter orientalis]NMT63205.1 endonuclease/exonuclease/phosphatase family protein [Marinobacter orientalis]TGX51859.1 endonuclease/exonuclease/phosphatase family protein [Marinobacter orientalis]